MKNSSTLDVGGSGVVKQGTNFSSVVISSQLERVVKASFFLALPPGMAAGASSLTGQVSSAKGLTTNSWQGLIVSEGGTCTIGTSGIGSSRGAS